MGRDKSNLIDLDANPYVKRIQAQAIESPLNLRYNFFKIVREMAIYLDILKGLPLDANKFISSMSLVMGMRGTGKTNTVTRIIEQLLKWHIPLSIIDLEGEYWSLQGMFPWLKIVGNTRKANLRIPLDEEAIKIFAKQLSNDAVYKQQSYILDLSETGELQMPWFLTSYLKDVYAICDDLFHQKNWAVHVIIMEEAQQLIPLRPIYGNSDWALAYSNLKQTCKIIATQGRKRGMGAILATQRNAEIDRTITSQCDMRFMHRVKEIPDLKLYADMFQEPFAWLKKHVPNMGPGEILYKDTDTKNFFKVKLRESFHPSRTPDYSDVLHWRSIVHREKEKVNQ